MVIAFTSCWYSIFLGKLFLFCIHHIFSFTKKMFRCIIRKHLWMLMLFFQKCHMCFLCSFTMGRYWMTTKKLKNLSHNFFWQTLPLFSTGWNEGYNFAPVHSLPDHKSKFNQKPICCATLQNRNFVLVIGESYGKLSWMQLFRWKFQIIFSASRQFSRGLCCNYSTKMFLKENQNPLLVLNGSQQIAAIAFEECRNYCQRILLQVEHGGWGYSM